MSNESTKQRRYPLQDLSSLESTVIKMVEQGKRLTTIYRFLRSKLYLNSIGDYPLIAYIFFVAKKKKKVFTPSEVKKALRQAKDGEFEKIHRDHILITQLYW